MKLIKIDEYDRPFRKVKKHWPEVEAALKKMAKGEMLVLTLSDLEGRTISQARCRIRRIAKGGYGKDVGTAYDETNKELLVYVI